MSLTRQFISSGYQSRFVVPLTDKSQVIEKWGKDFGVSVDIDSSVPSDNERSWKQMLRFSNYIRSLKCPIVNLHYGQNHIPLKDVLAIRLAGVRKVFLTPHNAMPWEMLGDRRKEMTMRSAMLSTKIIAITDQTYELYIQAGIPKQKIVTIHCGFRDVPEYDKASIRKTYNIKEDAFVIMYAGRLATHKGVSDLIRSCSRLLEKIPNLYLLIVGDGIDRQILENEGYRPGNIDELTDSIYRLYNDPEFRRKLGDAACAFAKNNFTESIMFENYLKLYQQ